MEFLAIGKPAINIYNTIDGFVEEGKIYKINNKIENLGNTSAVVSCALAKWGCNSYISGIVGNDVFGTNIRRIFDNNKVNTRYLETIENKPSFTNYFTLNEKTGKSAKMVYNSLDSSMVRYKYDVVPEYALFDATQYDAEIAFFNNSSYNNTKSVYYPIYYNKDGINIAKKATWLICKEDYLNYVIKEEVVDSTEDYVRVYQKFVNTLEKTNIIVILDNYKILYSEDSQVKMLPSMKMNMVDSSSFDSLFTAGFIYGLSCNLSVSDAIKFANTAASLSIMKIGEECSIPELNDVIVNSNLSSKLAGVVNNTTQQTEVKTETVETTTPVVQETPVVNNINNEVAFNSTPVETPVNNVTQTPEMPVQPETPKQVETNIFDQYNE